MKQNLKIAILMTIVTTVLLGIIYPLVVTGLALVLFRDKANGSLIVDSSGAVRGSQLLGQQFTADKYFHPRPSAAGKGYDATASGGSNLGPTSTNLYVSIAQNISDYRSQNGLGTNDAVPADAVTASASGLDPHISIRNAELQTPRVAKARGLVGPAEIRTAYEIGQQINRRGYDAPDIVDPVHIPNDGQGAPELPV